MDITTITREELAHDVTVVGAALAPLGVLLGLESGDELSLAAGLAALLICPLLLVGRLVANHAPLGLIAATSYGLGAALVGLTDALGSIPVALGAVGLCEAALLVLAVASHLPAGPALRVAHADAG